MGYEVRDVFDILEKELTDYFLSLPVEKQVPLINEYYNTIKIIKLTDCLSDDQMENFYKKVENLYVVIFGKTTLEPIIYTKTELIKQDWFIHAIKTLCYCYDKFSFDDIEDSHIQDIIITMQNIARAIDKIKNQKVEIILK